MKNCTTDALPLLERDMPNTPYTLGWMRMEDFKRHAGVVLSLQREKNLVLLLVSSDGSVVPLLPLSCYAWLKENGWLDKVS